MQLEIVMPMALFRDLTLQMPCPGAPIAMHSLIIQPNETPLPAGSCFDCVTTHSGQDYVAWEPTPGIE